MMRIFFDAVFFCHFILNTDLLVNRERLSSGASGRRIVRWLLFLFVNKRETALNNNNATLFSKGTNQQPSNSR